MANDIDTASNLHALATTCRYALAALEQLVAPNHRFSGWKNHEGQPIDEQLNASLNVLRYLQACNWYGALKKDGER